MTDEIKTDEIMTDEEFKKELRSIIGYPWVNPPTQEKFAEMNSLLDRWNAPFKGKGPELVDRILEAYRIGSEVFSSIENNLPKRGLH